ncbi:MAG TPA: histidine kinase [Kofleriaceae bacterium]
MTRARRLWLLTAVWAVPAIMLALQGYYYDDSGAPHALLRIAVHEALPWAIWIPVSAAVLARADAGSVRGRRLAGHIAAAIAVGLGYGLINGGLGAAVHHGPDPMTLGDRLSMGIIDWLPYQPLFYAGVLATGIAIDAARRRRVAELGRAQLEAQLAYAQLGALRAQLQPHFLFNTLNAAVALARAGDAEGTAQVLVLLGDLLRQLLRGDAPQEVPLREELSLLETYLEIQRIRFGARLQVGWSIDDSVRDALVPQLVLQPLVENALQHGIARRTRAGRLDITATRRGGQLELTVCDDGPGVAPSFSLAAATGVGLRNTRDRLARLYGARGALALATVGATTTAAIELPIRTAAHG